MYFLYHFKVPGIKKAFREREGARRKDKEKLEVGQENWNSSRAIEKLARSTE